jgi:hypothetical protein
MRSLAGQSVVVDATTAFYRDALQALNQAQVPVLVGGSHALVYFTGVARQTKDFDIFCRRADVDRVLETLAGIGARTEVPYPHWLGKAHRDSALIDVIYCSGNGVALVDDVWFEQAPPARVLEVEAHLCPAEEMIWSKAFIMERERFDGADIAHLLRARGPHLDWARLLTRFGRHWRVLYAHLVLFGFVYPSERSRVPAAVMEVLAGRLAAEEAGGEAPRRVTYGTLLSRAQYLTDIEGGELEDGRDDPDVHMTPDDIELWTRVIADEVRPYGRQQQGDPPHRRRR